jgi:hypothetical protein
MVPNEKHNDPHDRFSTHETTEVKYNGKVKVPMKSQMSLARKLMLSAELWATEASVSYECLYTIPLRESYFFFSSSACQRNVAFSILTGKRPLFSYGAERKAQ